MKVLQQFSKDCSGAFFLVENVALIFQQLHIFVSLSMSRNCILNYEKHQFPVLVLGQGSLEYSSSQFGENCVQKLTMLIFTHCPLIVQQKSLVQASLTARTFNNKSFIFILRQCKVIAQIDMDFVYLGASLTLS